MKLQIEVVNGRLRRSVEALVYGKGLPCLQIRVGSVTKALQPLLDVLLWNAKFPQFSGTDSVVQNSALLLLHGALASNRHSWASHHQQVHVVLPGHPPCLLASGHCFRAGTFSGSPHRLLDCFLTFRGSEENSDVVLCTI